MALPSRDQRQGDFSIPQRGRVAGTCGPHSVTCPPPTAAGFWGAVPPPLTKLGGGELTDGTAPSAVLICPAAVFLYPPDRRTAMKPAIAFTSLTMFRGYIGKSAMGSSWRLRSIKVLSR
jgi:hypothetical protein